MKRLLIGAVAAVAAVGVGIPAASAAPTNGAHAIVFPGTECVAPDTGESVTVDFVVNGGGRAGAHTSVGNFQPLALFVTVNGDPDPDTSFQKNNVGKSNWICLGEATVDFGDGPTVIAFTAFGNFS
jgi:hypothetical protein